MIKAIAASALATCGILRRSQSVITQPPIRPDGRSFSAFGRFFLCAAAVLLIGPGLSFASDTPVTGTVEGRVSNSASGSYLNHALVTIRGTSVETLTDEDGNYRLTDIPSGAVQIAVTFSGMATQTERVSVAPGQVVQRDFALDLATSDVVQMDKYTVTARELSAAAVADEERRTAPIIKSVVSIDQFGDMGEGNIGEFLKYVPGVDMLYNPQVPQYASVRGMPSTGTIMELNGQEVATAQNGTRSFDLGIMAAGNVDRIEVSKEPTPDMPANAVGGMINVITKNGFSVSQPVFTYNVFLTAGGSGTHEDAFSLHSAPSVDPKTSGPTDRPAYNLSYIVPVSKRLAFTVAASQSKRYSDLQYFFTIWDQVRNVETYNRVEDVPFNEKRDLGAISAIFKINDQSNLQASFQATDSINYVRVLEVNAQTGAGATGGPDFSQGASTAVGSAQQVQSWNDQYHTLENGTLSYHFGGKLWEIDAAATWSQAGTKVKDVADGFFSSMATTIPSLVVSYAGIQALGEQKGSIDTATDKLGNPVNINNGNNYSVTSASSGGPLNNTNTRKHADFSVRREFDLAVPFWLKVGGWISRTTSDATGGAYGSSFTPPGGAAGQLASNYDLIATSYSAGHPFDGANGQPINVSWLSPYKMYNLFLAHPEYFPMSSAQQGAQYVSQVNTAKDLQETIPAAYLRGDVKFFANRLWLVGGVRFEQTRDAGLGPLQNISAGFQKDANGNNLLSSTGALIPISADTLTEDKLEYTKYGMTESKSYSGYYPSMNVTYNFTPELLVRAAYAKTIGRPDISLIIPGTTVTDTATGINTITVINSALKPWSANNYDLALEIYNIKGATVSISGYRKELTNFFGTTTSPATSDQLAAVGLPATDVGSYNYVTMQNFGAATIQGIEFSYRQSLAPFVPFWAKGLELFGNVTTQTLSGPNAASFSTFSPHDANWGVSYSLPRFNANINVQQRGWIRESSVAASATEPAGLYNYYMPQTRIDVSAEYRLFKHLSLFGSVRNLNRSPVVQAIRGPGVAIAPYTVPQYWQYIGALYTLGIKGVF